MGLPRRGLFQPIKQPHLAITSMTLGLVQTVVDEVARAVDDVLAILHSLLRWPFIAPGGGIHLVELLG